MNYDEMIRKLDEGKETNEEADEIAKYISKLLKGDFFSKKDDALMQIIALCIDRTKPSQEQQQKSNWAFDILHLRATERLVSETHILSRTTWGLTVATWLVAFATMFAIFIHN